MSKAYSDTTPSRTGGGSDLDPCPLKRGRPTRQWLRPCAKPLTGGARWASWRRPQPPARSRGGEAGETSAATAGATGHRRRRPTSPRMQGNEAETTPGVVDDGELGSGSCVRRGGRPASVKMELRPWWIRRRTELREICAGEWVDLWWWREREGMLGSLEFSRSTAAAMAA